MGKLSKLYFDLCDFYCNKNTFLHSQRAIENDPLACKRKRKLIDWRHVCWLVANGAVRSYYTHYITGASTFGIIDITVECNHPDWCSKGRRMAASSNFFLKCHFTMYWHCQMSNLTSPSKIVLDMPNPIHTLYILRNMYALLSILIAISGQVDIHTQ